jgi:ABC-type transporter Mla subunit MlaD
MSTPSDAAKAALTKHLYDELSESYDATRVWEAWSVGTMGQDDFVPVNDRLESIIEGLFPHVQAFADQQTAALTARVAAVEKERDEERIKACVAHQDFMAMNDAREAAVKQLKDTSDALEEARRQLQDTTDAYDSLSVQAANEINENGKLRRELAEAQERLAEAKEHIVAILCKFHRIIKLTAFGTMKEIKLECEQGITLLTR